MSTNRQARFSASTFTVAVANRKDAADFDVVPGNLRERPAHFAASTRTLNSAVAKSSQMTRYLFPSGS
jgi:hypothetical protein